jgi:hypothetical protein
MRKSDGLECQRSIKELARDFEVIFGQVSLYTRFFS